jgi:hypothetical protein
MRIDTAEEALARPRTQEFEDALEQLSGVATLLCRENMAETGSDSCMLWVSRKQDTTPGHTRPTAELAALAADEVFAHYFPVEARLTSEMGRIAHGVQFRVEPETDLAMPRAIITIGRALPSKDETGQGNALSMQNLFGAGLKTADNIEMDVKQVGNYADNIGIHPGLIYGVEALAKLPDGNSGDVSNTFAHLFNLFGHLAKETDTVLLDYSLYVELNQASEESLLRNGVRIREGAYGYEGDCYFPSLDEETGLPDGYILTGSPGSGLDRYRPYMIMGGRENSHNFEIAEAILGSNAVYLLNGELDTIREIAVN